MKRLYYQFTFAFFLLFSMHTNAQGTETFEAPLPLGSTSWTTAGLTFSTSSSNFNTEEFVGAGAGDSDRFLDNISAPAINSTYSVNITGGATLFTMESMELYLSSSANGIVPTNDGSLTIRGLVGSTQVFTYTKSAGFPTSLIGVDNGFILVDFTTLPGVGDVTSINIDAIEITINGAFQYFSLDNFEFDNQVQNTDPPEVQSIAVVGTPNSTATSIDFLVTFNEDAFLVDASDFIVDATGTFGTISGISGSGTAYTVSVGGISGEGTISIDLISGNNIEDAAGNGPVAAFTSGEDHFVSRCFQETFEGFSVNDFTFSSNGVTFTTSTTNFNVELFSNGGAGSSNQFLSNNSDQGTGKVYSITTPGTEIFTVEAIDVYLSSLVDAPFPTNDGALTLEGRLSGSTLYSIQKTSGLPTTLAVNNGYYVVDFATEGAADYSLTNIDELRITIGGAFQYIALDNFEHCEEVTTNLAPIVQNINLIGNPLASSSSVNFEVVFNEDAVNVTANDFSLNLVGSAIGTISGVSGSGNTYTVSVNSISGEGSLRLDLNAGTDIADLSGNTPSDPFTEGERFTVSICNVETFEGLADGTFAWTTNTVPWSSGATSFSVDEFLNAGAGGSDRYIDNLTSQGTGDINTIAITNTQMVKMGSMEIYVSSILNGTFPTDDGTLTVRGKLDGTTLYTVTKSTGFATVIGSNQGYYLWDFATEGGVDHSMTDVDEIEFEIGGNFQYLAVDNFKFCIDPNVAPVITCPTNITQTNDAGQCGAVVTFAATDAVGFPVATITYSQDSGTLFPVGTTTVTATATNTAGTSECMFAITIEDNELPEILNCPTEFTIILDGSGNGGSIDLTDFTNAGVTYSDNCGIDTVEVSANVFDCSVVSSEESGDSVWINEFHYDNSGTDTGEFVEIAGNAGFDLTDYSVVLYNGSNGASYNTINLSGNIDDEGNGFGAVSVSAAGIQNGGPDGIALVNGSTLVEFISYEGSFIAVGGPANGITSTDIGVSEASSTPIGESLQLSGTGSTGTNFSWSGPSPDSPGTLNAGQTITIGGPQVTLTVTDVNGNVSICSVPVTVLDNEVPEILNCPSELNIVLDGSGNGASINLNDFDNAGVTYSDNCGIDTVEVSANTFDCSDVSSEESGGSVWINEFHYDNSGTDTGEFVEIAGNAGFDLTDYSVVLYNGSNGASYITINLSGNIDDEGNGFGAVSVSAAGIQNGGPDGIALVNGSTLVEFISYEGSFVAVGGPANGITSIDIGVSEASSTPIGESLQLSGTGSTGTNFSWSGPSADSPGTLNTGQTITIGGPQVTLTVTDVNGNVSTCVVPVTVVDNEAPVANCPTPDASYIADSGDCDATLTFAASPTDNCSVQSTVYSVGVSEITFPYNFPVGSTTVDVQVTDVNSNTDSCSFEVNVTDDEAPVTNCPTPDISYTADNGECDATLTFTAAPTDNCGVQSTVYSVGSSEITFPYDFPVGSTTVDVLVTDVNSNTDSCSFEVIVTDDEAPIIECQDITIQVDENGIATIDAFDIINGNELTSSDNWLGFVGILNNAGDFQGGYGAGLADITSNFNGSNQLTLQPNFQPQNASNTNIQGSTYIEIDNMADTPLRFSGSTNKNTLTSAHYAFAFIRVFNSSGDFLEEIDDALVANSDFSVQYNVHPDAFRIQYGFTVQGPGANPDDEFDLGNAVVSNMRINSFPTDACGIDEVTIDNDSFSCDNLGANTVNITVTDINGNTSICSATVTVIDTIAPIVDCLSVDVQLDAFGNGSILESDIDGDSSDNCDLASITLSQTEFTCSDINGDLDELIISEYVDGSGNNDWIEIFNGTGDPVILGEPVNGNLVSYYSINIYTDGSSTPTTIGLLGTIGDRETYKIAHSDAANIAGINSNFGDPDIVFDGNDAIALANNGVAVDVIGVIGVNPGSGWTSTSNSTDTTTLVRSETVEQGNVSTFLANFENEWIQFAQNDVSNLGDHDIIIVNEPNNVILTVTDTSGNVSTCEGSVTVVDFIEPEALCQDVTVTLNENGIGFTSAQAVNAGSNDACGIRSLELSQIEFGCDDVDNPVTVTLTVTDSNGNTSQCNAIVTVLDEEGPVVVCNPITVQLDNTGNYALTDYTVQGTSDVDTIGAGSTDACGIATMSVSPNSFTCANVGSPVTVELTVTDNNGNMSTCQTTVTVEDNAAPEALCKPATVQLDDNGDANITVDDIDNGSTDACGIASRTLDITEFTCADVGSPVTVELTVTDTNGNVSTCEALVTVLGDLPTVTINAPEELPEFCQGAVLVLTTNATNAASYLWSPGGETTDSIEVDPQGGTFTVTVTSATNCTSSDTYTVAPFDASTLLSSYTILAEDEVFLHGSNLVQSGGIGATDANGLIKLHQASTVVEFGRAATIVLNQGSTIVNPIFQPANIPFPGFVTNTLSNNTSPNVTINNNQSTTLNGSVYGTITVKQGATVTFSQSDIYINQLKTFGGASIEFLGCANVFINDKFKLAQNGTINEDGNNVVIFVNEDVQIEKGSYVRARIHSNGNELLAKGPNGNGNNSGDLTQMIGLFIAKKVHGNKNVVWNSDDVCSPCSAMPPSAPIIIKNKNFGVDEFEVLSWPNPSETVFKLKLKTLDLSSESHIKVFDISNKLIFTDSFMPDDTYSFGKELEGGVYIVRVIQGQKSKTIRVVKY